MSRNTIFRAVAAMAGLVVLSLGATCHADTTTDARAIIEANKESVVTVQIVVETTMSYEGESQKRQTKASATGTIIDPSGLVVTSLTAVNPADKYQDMMPEGEKYKASSRIVDAKIRLDDGSEVAADVMLRDRDLDLAFLKPKKAPEKPYKYVDLSQASTPKLLDEVVFLLRLGQVANRSLASGIERVAAVLTKPRLSYVAGMSSYSFGFPSFALDGKPVGILVLRSTPGADSDAENFSFMDRMVPVILPCSTVLDAAEQAKTAKPEKVEAAPAVKPAGKPATKTATKSAIKPVKK